MTRTDTPWTTLYPEDQDTVGSEQPDLYDDSSPGAGDGSRILTSHVTTSRDKLQSLADVVGSDRLEEGSLRKRLADLEESGRLPALGDDGTALMVRDGVALFDNIHAEDIVSAWSITSVSVSPSYIERGDSVAVDLTIAYPSGRPPVAPVTVTPNGDSPVTITSPFTSKTLTGPYTTARTFTVSAQEEGGSVKTNYGSLAILDRLYYGVAVRPASYNEAFVQGLATSALAAARQRTLAWTATGEERGFYCVPVAFESGMLSGSFIDLATGFAFGITRVAELSVENNEGAAVTCGLWETDNYGFGAKSCRCD